MANSSVKRTYCVHYRIQQTGYQNPESQGDAHNVKKRVNKINIGYEKKLYIYIYVYFFGFLQHLSEYRNKIVQEQSIILFI